jgi:hypothetical protein
MPNIWVLCETWKNPNNILCLRCKYCTILFYLFFYKKFSSQGQKQKMKILHIMDQSHYGGAWKWTQILHYFHNKIGVLLELKCKKTKSMQFPYNFYYQLYFIYVKGWKRANKSQRQPLESLWLVLRRWYGSTRLDEMSWCTVKQWCLNNIFTLFRFVEKHWLGALKCAEMYFIFIGLLSILTRCQINIWKRASHKYNIYFQH